MHHAIRTLIAAASLALLLAGCSANPTSTRGVQPPRTLDEMYDVQARVNEHAQAYDLGTGDALGHYTYGNYMARTMTATSDR